VSNATVGHYTYPTHTLHIPYTGGTGRQAVADERNAQEAGAELQGRRAGELCSELKARAKPKQGELEQARST
jgi:hypothetical protein